MVFSERDPDISDENDREDASLLEIYEGLQSVKHDVESYENIYPQEIKELIEQYPDRHDDIKELRNNLTGYPMSFPDDSDAVLIEVVYIRAKLHPEDCLRRGYERLKKSNVLYAKEVLDISVFSCFANSPGSVIKYFPLYREQDYAEEMLRKAVQEDHYDALGDYESYEQELYAKEILEQIVWQCIEQKDTRIVLDRVALYMKEAYAPEALGKLAVLAPIQSLMAYTVFENELYAKQILKKILYNVVEKDPMFALMEFSLWENEGYTEDLLEKVVWKSLEYNVSALLRYYHIYKDKSYADRVIYQLLEKKPQELLWFETVYGPIPDDERFMIARQELEGLKEIQALKIGNMKLALDQKQHINLYTGLYKTYLANKSIYKNGKKILWRKVKKDYEDNLQKYIDKGNEREKENTICFFLSATDVGGDDYRNVLYYDKMREQYKTFCTEESFHDYSSDIASNIASPEHIIATMQHVIDANPGKKIMIYAGLHGSRQGGAGYAGGDFTQENFEELFNISRSNSENVIMYISSCYSGNKDITMSDNLVKNITLDSGSHVAQGGLGGGNRYFLESFDIQEDGSRYGDFDGDGVVNIHEAILYRNIHYHYSLTPTYFDHQGKMVPIS